MVYFIVKGKKVTSDDLKKQILSEIRKFLIDNGLLTMFYETSIKVLPSQGYIKICKIDELARIANKILMPYFVMYLHQHHKYCYFREIWKEFVAKKQKNIDYALFPPFVRFYEFLLSYDNIFYGLYSWNRVIEDIVYLKDKDMPFFKPSLKTRIFEKLMKIW